ncbi:hypothetical protein GIB67_007722 [Kingdonia uniflora]|uniref:Cucumisin n=1 Tax=Kingdonia uniflora TaxID=39325 RepID=A0A7J7N1L2_9MAGN|nr:hypothetical protein GIB67_007722 [Kingdonia uniflora]
MEFDSSVYSFPMQVYIVYMGHIPKGDFSASTNHIGTLEQVVGRFRRPHTSSTAAARKVSEASLLGLGLGIARGGVPSACIAVYKVCCSFGCYDADILAGFDDAIADGVDIISVSLGGSYAIRGVAVNTFTLEDRMYPLVYGGDVPNPGFQGYSSDPTATILKSNEDKDKLAPYVVSFSSRGPNPMTSSILKPDIVGPGVDIVAAWSPVAPVSLYSGDNRVVSYNIISGTSMACPHATAAAAYAKSFHPKWSPSAIKSALMTKTYPMSNATNTDAEFAYGSDHINPVGAIDPGLIYDAGEADYVRMLCAEGYDTKTLQIVTGDNSSCTTANNGTVYDLNYPSSAVTVDIGESFEQIFHRTVTNVGSPVSIYKARMSAPSGIKIDVAPTVLSFKLIGEKGLFVVKVRGKSNSSLLSSSLVWSDEVYVVYMGDRPKDEVSASSYHMSMLEEAVDSGAAEAMVYSYKRSFNGFAAKLTEEEMQKIAGMEGVVSVFLSKQNQLHTTRSWDFTGFPQTVKRTTVESSTIVGMFDTGVWPEADSFDDKGFGPSPSKWKGSCQSSSNFTCNNKIIGARYYRSGGAVPATDFGSPRDSEGHGTHTASTAAGLEVTDASLLGLGLGTARGGVPSARLAIYKICWSDGCYDADLLAAFDDAIADGVDIISLSVGGSFPSDYFEDSIAIGAFHAMKNGILTSNSAGNSGPFAGSVSNYSPWSLTVAASTIDREFVAKVQLGNGKVYEGTAINTFTLNKTSYPMIYGGDAPNIAKGFDGSISRYCSEESLDTSKVTGKIVFCDEISSGSGSLLAGAVGTVMQDSGFEDVAFSFPLSATHLSLEDGSTVYTYLNTTSNATANILKSNEVNDTLAPFVVSFSSRGPNPITSDILKPDLTAPGVDILAAWPPISSVSGSELDTRSVKYNIISGTSMSCPHATGAAAYVKTFHPSWSPAAIKSALMTTANPMSTATNTDAEFAFGAGHINPVKAVVPGLIYDAGEADYVKMLCGSGYSTKNLRLVTGDASACSKVNNGTVWDLNYPSFALTLYKEGSFSATYHRTVTNVGSPGSVYKATINSPSGIKIKAIPSVLSFKTLGQKLSFALTVAGSIGNSASLISSTLIWDDGVYQVRSPIVVNYPTEG